jgi:hypothetical protein
VTEVPDVRLVGREDGRFVVEVGGGHYRFLVSSTVPVTGP